MPLKYFLHLHFIMALVTFYEKPGCMGNARQKQLLIEAGHRVQAVDLLSEPWSAERLNGFFGNLPVQEWFNPAASRIKSGEVTPAALKAEQALKLMLGDPLLIRRPLMQVGDECLVGFDLVKVEAWIGLSPKTDLSQDVQKCRMPSQNESRCP